MARSAFPHFYGSDHKLYEEYTILICEPEPQPKLKKSKLESEYGWFVYDFDELDGLFSGSFMINRNVELSKSTCTMYIKKESVGIGYEAIIFVDLDDDDVQMAINVKSSLYTLDIKLAANRVVYSSWEADFISQFGEAKRLNAVRCANNAGTSQMTDEFASQTSQHGRVGYANTVLRDEFAAETSQHGRVGYANTVLRDEFVLDANDTMCVDPKNLDNYSRRMYVLTETHIVEQIRRFIAETPGLLINGRYSDYFNTVYSAYVADVKNQMMPNSLPDIVAHSNGPNREAWAMSHYYALPCLFYLFNNHVRFEIKFQNVYMIGMFELCADPIRLPFNNDGNQGAILFPDHYDFKTTDSLSVRLFWEDDNLVVQTAGFAKIVVYMLANESNMKSFNNVELVIKAGWVDDADETDDEFASQTTDDDETDADEFASQTTDDEFASQTTDDADEFASQTTDDEFASQTTDDADEFALHTTDEADEFASQTTDEPDEPNDADEASNVRVSGNKRKRTD